ncbi:hypothetical protein ACFV30_20460 [Streptomyces sp. NPDC059752]|uniref:hypothetical protein n=1 Tax=unclassified Streptomyces TaxID=2593676 RepID=UPI0036488D2B
MALELAKAWSKIPAEHFQIAVDAITPQMQREHELRVQAHSQFELDRKRRYSLELLGLWIGAGVAVISLGAAIYFGIQAKFWAMAIMAGPSIFVLIKLFVLRKSDASDSGLFSPISHLPKVKREQ